MLRGNIMNKLLFTLCITFLTSTASAMPTATKLELSYRYINGPAAGTSLHEFDDFLSSLLANGYTYTIEPDIYLKTETIIYFSVNAGNDYMEEWNSGKIKAYIAPRLVSVLNQLSMSLQERNKNAVCPADQITCANYVLNVVDPANRMFLNTPPK